MFIELIRTLRGLVYNFRHPLAESREGEGGSRAKEGVNGPIQNVVEMFHEGLDRMGREEWWRLKRRDLTNEQGPILQVLSSRLQFIYFHSFYDCYAVTITTL